MNVRSSAVLPTISLNGLKDILVSASRIVRELYEDETTVNYKPDGTPVTAADRETNRFLQVELAQLFPQAAWLSEESVDDRSRLDCDWVWVVDPLDGSKEFVRRIPEFAISVGPVHHNNVVMGGVVNPVMGHIGGEHSFWGMIPPKLRVAETLAHATATVSRTDVEDGSVASYLNLVGTTHPVGSVAYKLMRVAAVAEDLTFSVQPKSEWDSCGGVALLVASGKGYSRLDGNPVKFNQLRPLIASGAVAGNRRLVLEFLQKYSMLRHGYGGALASNGKARA